MATPCSKPTPIHLGIKTASPECPTTSTQSFLGLLCTDVINTPALCQLPHTSLYIPCCVLQICDFSFLPLVALRIKDISHYVCQSWEEWTPLEIVSQLTTWASKQHFLCPESNTFIHIHSSFRFPSEQHSSNGSRFFY